MIDQIVSFLSRASSAAVNLAITMFDSMGVWGIVFAGISVILIARFILGPLLGFTASGASDVVRSSRSKKEES